MGNHVQELQPSVELNILLRRWYVLVAMAILGGLLGWIVSLFLLPIYEARAVLLVNLDLPQVQYYTDAQTDYILSSTIHLVTSSETFQQLIANARDAGHDLQVDDFYLDRQGSRWDLVVRSTDPALGARIANAWLDISLARLDTAHAHSVQAAELATQMVILQGCLTCQDHPLCQSFTDSDQLQTLLENLWRQYQQEEAASLGLNPSLTFLVDARAAVPETPVLFQRSVLILAAAGLGLLFSMPVVHLIRFRQR